MKQKLTIIVHKFDKSLLIVKTQLDLSILLGVSLSTIKRNYNDVGIYDTDIYTVYVDAQYYDNGIEHIYKHDVIPPTIKQERTIIPINSVIVNQNDQVIVQSISPSINMFNNNEALEEDISEENLIKGQYDDYYSTKSMSELTKSVSYYKYHPERMKVIEKYYLLRQDELF